MIQYKYNILYIYTSIPLHVGSGTGSLGLFHRCRHRLHRRRLMTLGPGPYGLVPVLWAHGQMGWHRRRLRMATKKCLFAIAILQVPEWSNHHLQAVSKIS